MFIATLRHSDSLGELEATKSSVIREISRLRYSALQSWVSKRSETYTSKLASPRKWGGGGEGVHFSIIGILMFYRSRSFVSIV